jgi:Na+/proline symporter
MFAADTTIFEKALYAFTIYGTAITPTLLAAFFWDKATKYGAIASILSGVIATVYFGNTWSLDEAVIPAITISASALVLISHLTTKSK